MKAIILGVLLSFTLFVSGYSDTMYSVGQPQALTNSMRENTWRMAWNDVQGDFEGIVQQCQIFSAGGELLLTVTDNEELFIFTKNLEINKWDYSLKEIPAEALKLCTYIGSLEQNGQMVAQAVNTVYYDQNGYYHLTEAPGGVSQNKMTNQAARYLIELTELELSSAQKLSDHEFYLFIN